MAVVFDEKKALFTMYTKNSMYQMKKDDLGVLLHTYYGRKTENTDYSYLIYCKDRGFAANPYDAEKNRTYSTEILPQEYSCFGTADYRTSALRIRTANGCRVLDLRFDHSEVLEGKYSIPGMPAVYAQEGDRADTLVVTLKDQAEDIFVHLYYGVMENLDMITRAVRIENGTSGAIYLEKAASMCLDQMYGSYDWMTFYGKHEMERNLSRTPVHHGLQSVGSVRWS